MGEDELPIPEPHGGSFGGRFAPRMAGRLVVLSAAMRAGGAPVGVGQLLDAHRALASIDSTDRAECYFALRSALCSGERELEVFDAAFGEVFATVRKPGARAREKQPERRAAFVPDAWPPRPELEPDRDFAEYSSEELAAVRPALAALVEESPAAQARERARGRPLRPGTRPQRSSARLRPRSQERHWRAPADRPRSLVLAVDGSAAMAPYASALLAYGQLCVDERRPVEAFGFGASLACVTDTLRDEGPVAALAQAGCEVGAGAVLEPRGVLDLLVRDHSVLMARDPVVVLLGNGEPLALEPEDGHRVLALDPTADDRPDLLSGRSLASLAELARRVERSAR